MNKMRSLVASSLLICMLLPSIMAAHADNIKLGAEADSLQWYGIDARDGDFLFYNAGDISCMNIAEDWVFFYEYLEADKEMHHCALRLSTKPGA